MFTYVVLPSSLVMAVFLLAINVLPPPQDSDAAVKLALRLLARLREEMLWEKQIGGSAGICRKCAETWQQLLDLRRHSGLSVLWYKLLLMCACLYTVAVICKYVEAPLKATVLPGMPRATARATWWLYIQVDSSYYAAIDL